MNHIIAGMGEVGRALQKVLGWQAGYIDPKMRHSEVKGFDDPCGMLHLCFPYKSEEWLTYARAHQSRFSPKYTVVHSTVPIGTSRKISAVHSPVIGMHPRMEESLRTFTKFVAGREWGADVVADEFRKHGLKVYVFDEPETSELCKLQCTTLYGLMIEFTKEMYKLCGEMASSRKDIPFEAWTLWNESYNRGYQALGCPEYTRPMLVPLMKPLGGHCVGPNLDLLDTAFTKFLKDITSHDSTLDNERL
jgi:hypothetical protein